MLESRLGHPAHPRGLVLPHPVLRQAHAEEGRGDRHHGAGPLLRAGARHERPVVRPRQRRRARGRGAAEAEGGADGGGPGPAEGEAARRHGHRDARSTPSSTWSPIHKTWTWWSSGDVDFTAGMLLDGPAVMMLFVVTLISLLVHVYSTDYVGGDRRYTHYFAFLSLFTRVDARPGHEREHPAAAHVLGAGGALLVRAHRPLVGGEAELRRGPQGVHHEPRRRRGPASAA